MVGILFDDFKRLGRIPRSDEASEEVLEAWSLSVAWHTDENGVGWGG